MINGHGDDAYNYSGNIVGDFSSNIPYRHHGESIARHLKETLSSIHHYPDPHARELCEALHAFHNLSDGVDILVTNGSAESFYLLAHLFAGSKSLITYPSFAEYEDACALYKHEMDFIPVDQLMSIHIRGYKTLWCALPNNPDGYIIPIDNIRWLCESYPDTYIIVDNAYGDLCPTSGDLVSLHSDYPNLISIHSLTKTYAIPGLRIGYTIASSKLLSRLHPYRMPWTVNSLALSAGLFIVKHHESLRPDAEALCAKSQELQMRLASIDGLEVLPSSCNFFLCRLQKGSASDLKSYLVQHHGLLIRDASNFRGLTPRHFRVSVQTSALNERLYQAIVQYLQNPLLLQK